MPDAGNQRKPKANIESVLAEFDGKKDTLLSFCETTKILMEQFLQDAKIQFQSVQARIKKREKLKAKYLDPRKNYEQLDDITDQVALRIITYYEDEVDRVADTIRREFEIDPNRSVDKRETEPDKFGYYSLNFICKYSRGRVALGEYKKFADVWCEIQITSILRHAWSEIEHPWYDLKDAFPPTIKRRFARMAALLEIAESEFLSLRKIQADYQQSVGLQVEANVADIPVDVVSIRSFIEQEPLVAEIDRSIAAKLGRTLSPDLPDQSVQQRSRSALLAGMKKIQDIRDALAKYGTVLPEFAHRCREELWSSYRKNPSYVGGVCIYNLSMFLVSVQGSAAIREFLTAYGFTVTWDIDRQAAIAQEIRKQLPS